MFDIGATELFIIAVVAILIIGPKDMPLALRTGGRWLGKMRRISTHFRSGLDTMVREAEMEEMEKKWSDQNDRIMREHPEGLPSESEMAGTLPSTEPSSEAGASGAEAAVSKAAPSKTSTKPAPRASATAKAEAKTKSRTKTKSGTKAKGGAKAKGADLQLPLDSAPPGN